MSVFDCLMLTWSSVEFFGLSTVASRVITCVVWHSQLANSQKCEETSTAHGPDHSCDPGMLSWLSLWLDLVEYIRRKCGQWLIPFSTLCFRTPLPFPENILQFRHVNPQMGNICKCQTAGKWTFMVCYVIPCWARYDNEDNNLQTEWRQNLLSHGQWNHIHLWTRFQIAIFRTSISTLGGLGKARCKNWTASSSFRSSVWWLSEE